jgi:hypothetical protein
LSHSTRPLCARRRPTAGQREVPQVPTVLQEEEEKLVPSEKLPLLDPFEANVEIFLVIFWLPQIGQLTSLMAFEERTSSSKDWLQSVHTNSNKGMRGSSIGIG